MNAGKVSIETPVDGEVSSSPVTRRAFLGGMAAGAIALSTGCAGFPSIVPRHVLGGPRFVAPGEKVRIAGIGLGGQGIHDFKELTADNVPVAVCDVNRDEFSRYTSKEKGWPGIKTYDNYEEMLDAEADNLDAVMIATPDHLHAHASMAALARGLHVFTEKPLCHNLHETQVLRAAAKKAGVATLIGTQGHASLGIRQIREWIEQGAIGNPTEVWYWTDRPIWPQGLERPAPQETPGFLNWDRWLGPAAVRPYNSAYQPFAWRAWCDFGTGALGDIGCHAMDAAFWSLGLTEPTRVEVETGAPCNGETYPQWSILTYHFPATKTRGPIKVKWYDGKKQPPVPEELSSEGRTLMGDIGGQLIIGDEGKLLAGTYGDSPRLIPDAAMRKWKEKKTAELYPRVREHSHYNQFLDACRGTRDPLMADFEYGAALTKMVLIGNLAVLAGQGIEWDAQAGRVTNLESANRFLTRDYRKGWEV